MRENIIKQKRNKRLCFNNILEALREPKTCYDLDKILPISRQYIDASVRFLTKHGYIEMVGLKQKPHSTARTYKALKFDFIEADIDYSEIPARVVKKKRSTSLADKKYVHVADDFEFEYGKQNEQIRNERKSARVWVGISGIYSEA